MLMRLTGIRKKMLAPVHVKTVAGRNIFLKERKCQSITRKDLPFLLLTFASTIFFFTFIIICVHYVRELHQISSNSSLLPRILHREVRSSHVLLNTSLLDSLPPNFCHHPDKPVVGLEGFVPHGFELQQVHIFTNPGETTHPLHKKSLPTQSDPVFCDKGDCKFRATHRINPKLKSFEDKVKKDSRFSTYFQPNFLEDQQCGHQELSPIGIQKLIMLGEFLRDVYIKDLNLENSMKTPKHIKVFYDGEKLSLKTSVALLFGFLSDNHLNKVKITNLSSNLCSEKVKSTHVGCHCPALQQEEKNIRNHLSQRADDSILSPLHLRQIMSSLCSYSNISCFAQNIEIINNSLNNFNVFSQKILQDVSFIDFVHVYLYPVFHNLIHKFRRTEYIFEKLFLYSVDDHILFYMLNVLKCSLKSWPRPGSRIVFELYKKTGQKFQSFYVRILYNGANISHNASLCHTNMEEGLCRLKNFDDLLHYVTERNIDLRTAYQSGCQN